MYSDKTIRKPNSGKRRSHSALFFSPAPLHAKSSNIPCEAMHHADPPRLQAKLKIGEANDEYEQEADQIADQVMRMPAPDEQEPEQREVQRKVEEEEEMLQTKCAACAEEDKMEPAIQRAANGAQVTSSRVTERISATRGSGRHLDQATQREMSAKLASDFSRVRIHTNQDAADMNQQLNARAFTVGNDIYFNQGQYSPSSAQGKHLLAHELAHTIQQRDLKAKPIQKADFDVDGLPRGASSAARRIFFTRGGTTIPASELAKLTPFFGSSINLTLKGTSSEEGSDATNTNIINARLTAVENELNRAGYTGTATRVVDVASGAGNIEYQRMRSVEIIPPGVTSTTPPAVATVACTDPLAGGSDYPTKWTDAETEAQRLISDGKAKLDAAARSATTDAALNRFFGSSSDATATQVSNKLTAISGQVTQYLDAANHQCVNQCSNSTASNVGSGVNAMLTLCPSFFPASLSERGSTTVHEAVHGTSSIRGSDTAYSHHRLIEFLTPADSLQNPDSYVLLLLTLDGQSPTVGPSSPDVANGMTASEETSAKQAIAWLEMYLTNTYLQLNTLYERLNGHRTAGTSTWPAGFYRNMMARAAPHFGLTTPPAVPANESDQVRLAAVFHRYRTMRNVFWRPVNMTKGSSNIWSAGPGNSVEVDAAFFGLSSMAQVQKLMELLTHATPDISGSLEPHYLTFMEEVRVLLGTPSPP